MPAPRPERALLAAFSLADPPSLHRLRRRWRGLVRRLRRYYEVVRLPTLVHLRLAASAFPERPSQRSAGRASVGPPGSRAWSFDTCLGSSTPRGPRGLAITPTRDVAFRP